uniref:Uncharacterized protein n=1 Tax=Amphimedon queenslandica TaxID=400682 RepID=A0A1X7V292_AMPQE
MKAWTSCGERSMSLEDSVFSLKRFLKNLIKICRTTQVLNTRLRGESNALYAARARVEHALALVHITPPSPAATVTPAVTARLAKLFIKNFNASITRWTPFWDSFKTSVHNNATLSDAEKFSYLHSFLSGKVFEAISGLSISDASYAIAVDILQKIFVDKEKTIAIHMDSLMSLEPVVSDH